MVTELVKDKVLNSVLVDSKFYPPIVILFDYSFEKCRSPMDFRGTITANSTSCSTKKGVLMYNVLERSPTYVHMTALWCYEPSDPQISSVGCFPGHGDNDLFSLYKHI